MTHESWRAAMMGLPVEVVAPSLVAYRSIGIGLFGATARYLGMPLEKIALYMNSSQVSGKNQLQQAVKLTFSEGLLAPYRVVGPASLTAWFLQYSVMGVAFQFFNQSLSQLFGVEPVWYGRDLMTPPDHEMEKNRSLDYQLRSAAARILSPVMASALESLVSNRAEAQRFFGPQKLAALEASQGASAFARFAGPAFAPNVMRNIIMCQTSFLLTPITYKLYFPQENKSKATLFWYGLGMNIFFGNVLGITQQALWGRSLDYLEKNGRIDYRMVIQQGLQKEGLSAFFTPPKWFSRVLMNAPAQGTLPWFYNEVLPLGEEFWLQATRILVYDPFLSSVIPLERSNVKLLRRRSSLGSLPTAHSDFIKHPTEKEPALPDFSRMAKETSVAASSSRSPGQ